MKTRKKLSRLSLLPMPAAAVLILWGITGCERSGTVTGPVTDQDVAGVYVHPDTPDKLMDNFAKAYQGMDLVGYAALLHEDFVFTFQACDVAKLGLGSDHFTRADELASAQAMFARKPHVKTDGRIVPAISSITFEQWDKAAPWRPAGDPDRPDILQGEYDITMRLVREGAGDLVVRGRCIFFAAPTAPQGDGDALPGYRLIGWIDRTKECGS